MSKPSSVARTKATTASASTSENASTKVASPVAATSGSSKAPKINAAKKHVEVAAPPEPEVPSEPPIVLDPALIAELNKIVDDAQNLKFEGDEGRSNTHHTPKPLEQAAMPAVESSVDDALVGALCMVVGVSGMLEPSIPRGGSELISDDGYTHHVTAAATSAPVSGPDPQSGHNPPSPVKHITDNTVDRDRPWIVDACGLGQEVECDSAVRLATFLRELSTHRHRIAGLRINGIKFSDAEAEKISANVWEDTGVMRKGKFSQLVDLDMSYIRIPSSQLSVIAHILNPIKSGYCPIKRLVLTQCRLGIQGTRTIFTALRNNVFCEELVLNGNHCTDAVMPEIVICMTSGANRFRKLGLGSNELTASSMEAFANTLEKHPYMEELQLNGNALGDDGVDFLFKALRDNPKLNSLNLSYCGIQECPWASRLRIMTALAYLNLSQNEITDSGCLALCDSLVKCACLRHLDLSNNLFGDRLSVKLGEVLEINCGLQSLNLSSNAMIYECWNAIAVGLAENSTLMRLDLRMCELDLRTAERIYGALAKNDIVHIALDMNALPVVLRENPRQYRRRGLPEALVPDPDAAGKSLIRGQRWRAGRVAELLTAKKSIEIIADLKETALLQEAERNARRAASIEAERENSSLNRSSTGSAGADRDHPRNGPGGLVNGSGLELDDEAGLGSHMDAKEDEGGVAKSGGPRGEQKGKHESMTLSLEKGGHGAPPQQAATGRPSAAADDSSVTSSMIISLGGHKAKMTREARKALDDGAANDNQGKLILTVCYGRESEVLGTIEVTHHTTYPQSAVLIKPLVKEYLSGLGQLEMAATLTDGFRVLDANGQDVQGPQSTVRTVWSEASQNHHMLIVRPANWIDLPLPPEQQQSAENRLVDSVTRQAAQDMHDEIRNRASARLASLHKTEDVRDKGAKAIVPPELRGTLKDPNFVAVDFVAFEYDDDVFGIRATDDDDDISVMSTDYDSSFLQESAYFDAPLEREAKDKVKWV